MKIRKTTLVLLAMLVLGLGLLLYPTFSDYWNSLHATRAISSYTESVAQVDNDRYAEIWADAQSYNREVAARDPFRLVLTDAEREEYEALLDVTGTGIMGYIEIQSLDLRLPIYHGTSASVLSSGVGHIEGTSLPVGGAGTHTVLSGHRGLPSARLFTDLDKLNVGDTFRLQILDETLTYEVDQILIVLPEEVDSLQISPDEDYCTLVTCTPYGINTHRLLVRGHRIENKKSEVRVSADAVRIDTIVVAPIVALPILLILLIILLATSRKPKKKRKSISETNQNSNQK